MSWGRALHWCRLHGLAHWALLVLVVAMAWLVWPSALGGSTSLVVVAGSSMEPTYHTGDVLLVKRRVASVGDVIVFTIPHRDGQIVHRVIERRDDGTMLVKGDNRSTPDLPLPTDANVVGVVRALVPQGLMVVRLLTSPIVLGVGAGSVVLARAVRAWQEASGVSVRRVVAAPTPSPTALLAAIGRAHRLYFRDVERPELFGQMLADILELTGCEYGFIGEVLHDEHDQPYLKSWALTDISWDEATKKLYAESQQPDGGLVFANLNTLFGRVLTTQRPVIANDPAHDPRRGGLPTGHPPLHSFLGVPLMRGDEMVGMVGIANRRGGFHEHDAEFLAPYLELCAHLIDVIRTDRERSAAQAAERDAREAAQRQERLSLIGRLASGIAHDMNNLITVVSMQCELLELDDHLSVESQRGVARIRDVCDTASTMADRLNGLRTRSPNAVVRCQPHDVIEQSQGVLGAIAGSDLTLEFHLDADLNAEDRVSMTDSDLLQVLMNLVSNARDATKGHGHVVVSTGLQSDPGRRWLRIEVSDDGPGIPTTLRGSAFDPFTSSKGPGHGLGLPTVRTLVEMADGRVELVDTEAPGTTFAITVPIVD